MTTDEKLDFLLRQIETLHTKQNSLQQEIEQLRSQAQSLKSEEVVLPFQAEEALTEAPPLKAVTVASESIIPHEIPEPQEEGADISDVARLNRNFEKFVGENLSNKLGAFFTVLGLGIGVKYAIDHDLISPLMRIVLGYVASFILLGVSHKLRPKYEDLSAVILSAGLASLYIITYFGYDLYQLIPQIMAFVMMVAVTGMTVAAALRYDRQIIALGGLVGAYFIPFLLSSGEERPWILFSYVAIINVGILIIAFQKYWQVLYYSAFVITWLLFGAWAGYSGHQFGAGMTFSTIFFFIFYACFLAYKVRKNEAFTPFQGLYLVLNAIAYLKAGHYFLTAHPVGTAFSGLFTLLCALVHLGVSLFVFRRAIADKSVFYLLSGLGLMFLALAAWQQFEGLSVTAIWGMLMVLQYWIGRTQKIPAYEHFARPLMVLSVFSLILHWIEGFYPLLISSRPEVTPIFNPYFGNTCLLIAAFWFMRRTHLDMRFALPSKNEKNRELGGMFFGLVLVFLSYFLFFNEIYNYFDAQYHASRIVLSTDPFNALKNDSILYRQSAWQTNYTLAFAIALNLWSIYRWKVAKYAMFAMVLGIFIVWVSLISGLENLETIRHEYLQQWRAEHFPITRSGLWLRYPFVALIGVLIWSLFKNLNTFFPERPNLRLIFDIGANAVMLIVLSSELIHWLEWYRYDRAHLWAISVLWGVYAFGLIFWGIRYNKQHLRLAAMALFGLTLVKVFLFDLAGLDTIQKTGVMIALGVLLLVISYLYNRYKTLLFQ